MMKKKILILLATDLIVAFIIFLFFYISIKSDFKLVNEKWTNVLKKDNAYKTSVYNGWSSFNSILSINEPVDVFNNNISPEELKIAKENNCYFLIRTTIPFTITVDSRTDNELKYLSYFIEPRYIGIKYSDFNKFDFSAKSDFFLHNIYEQMFKSTIGVDNCLFEKSMLNSKYYSVIEDISKIKYLQPDAITSLTLKDLGDYVIFYDKASHSMVCTLDVAKIYSEIKEIGFIFLIANIISILIITMFYYFNKTAKQK
jgi:hypothetical protein